MNINLDNYKDMYTDVYMDIHIHNYMDIYKEIYIDIHIFIDIEKT